MVPKWYLDGSFLEACNCEAVCPCLFLSPPTTGDCTVLIAWHIDRGNFGDVNLDGFNIVLAAHCPGHMMKVKWDVALYLEERTTEAQKDALTHIFAGQAGGHPAVLASLIGKVLGVRSVKIEYSTEGKRRSFMIPNLAEAEIEAIVGQGDADVTVTNHPLCTVPGQAATVAKSKRLTYRDYGFTWELSDKHGAYSPYTYAGP